MNGSRRQKERTMDERSIEADFGEAITELKKRQPLRRFLLESQYLGEVLDVTALRGMGWRVVDTRRGDKWLWRGCLWFERRVKALEGGEEALLRVATSGFCVPRSGERPEFGGVPDGKETDARLHWAKQALAFLRKVEILREADGGLRLEDWGADTPDWALAPMEDAFGECQWYNWNTFREDLAWLAKDRETQLPLGVYESRFNTSMGYLADVIAKEARRGESVTKRLLVRLVRALADEGYDPAGRAQLAEWGDGWTLERLLAHWLEVVPPGGAEAAQFLAYALERADELAAPYSAPGWAMLAGVLREQGFSREAVLAADWAAACPDADEKVTQALYGEIIDWVQHRFPGEKDDAKPGEFGWLVRLLHEREETLKDAEGFGTLLGLLLAANGNETKLAMDAIRRDLPQPLEEPPQRVRPRAWQALVSVGTRNDYWVRRALAAFPEPVLSRTWGKTDFPETVIAGMNDPDFLDAVGAWDDSCAVPAWVSRTVPAAQQEWAQLYPPEMAPGPGGLLVATNLQVFREEGAEIELFRVRGTCELPEGGEEAVCDWERHLALANPHKPNVVAAAWEFFPYEDNACGEIRFRAEGGEGALAAASVWFAADREFIFRGVPMPAYVYGLVYTMRRAEKRGPVRTADGDEIDLFGSRFLFEHLEPDSKALYEFHAEVKSVRWVKVAGGGEILKIELDAGNARLPCVLPVYARKGLLSDGVPSPGDVVEGVVFLQIDFYPSDERTRAWMKAHPDGPGPEPEDEGWRRAGALVSFAKRAPSGKRRIPVLDGRPGETVEIEDDALTPETLDTTAVAFDKMCSCLGRENCARWEENPDGVDLTARTAGRIHRYRVFKVLDDGAADVDRLPEGIEPLVVRIRDAGERYQVEFEGFPEDEDSEGEGGTAAAEQNADGAG